LLRTMLQELGGALIIVTIVIFILKKKARTSSQRPNTNSVDARPKTPQHIFTRVAKIYDFGNYYLSLGRVDYWRQRAVASINIQQGEKILDIATGTGALMVNCVTEAEKNNFTIEIIGIDINEAMMNVARKKIGSLKTKSTVKVENASAIDMPFPKDYFDCVIISMAIDDIGRDPCMKEIVRVLRPNGKLILVELSMPESQSMLWWYKPIVHVIASMPFSWGHTAREILTYPGRDSIRSMLQDYQFEDIFYENLTGGVAVLWVATKSSKKSK